MTSLEYIFPLLNRLPLSSNSLPTHVYIIYIGYMLLLQMLVAAL